MEKKKQKQFFKYLKRYSLVFCSVIIVMIVLLLMEKSIPNAKSRENIIKSDQYYYDYFDNQFSNVNIVKDKHATIDVTADLYHLSIIYLEKNKHPWKEFIEMNKDSLCAHKMVQKEGFQSYEIDSDYSRYWNGHLIVLKPLLSFFTMHVIYNIYLVIFSLVFSILVLKLLKKSKVFTFIFVISTVITNLFYVTNCDNLMYVFLISMISSIVLIYMYEKKNKNIDLIFLINGMLAVYFDLISCETITLTLPLFIYIFYKMKDHKKISSKEIIKYLCLWLGAYVLTFGVKWLLLMIHYHGHFIDKVVEPMMIRVFYEHQNIFSVFINSVSQLIHYFYPYHFNIVKLTLLIIGIISFIFILIKDKKNKNYYLWLFIISIIPFIRYFVLSSHSNYHNFFTYRAFLPFIMFMLFMIWLVIERIIKRTTSK